MKVAIVCSNASLRMGGEAAIPLRFFRYFEDCGADVLLLTHERVKEELLDILNANQFSRCIFFRDTAFQKFMHRISCVLPITFSESICNPLIRLSTERRQRNYIYRHHSDDLHIVFVPTPISPKAISLIHFDNINTFFGPLNGNMDFPPAFRYRRGRVAVAVTIALRRFSEPLNYIFPAKRRAAGIFVSNSRTQLALPRAVSGVPVFRSFDATVERRQWEKVDRSMARDSNRFLYLGRLVEWKAVEYAIEAMHKLERDAILTIVGDGPERQRLECLATSGPGRMEFLGSLSHQEIRNVFQHTLALVLPSLREAGGNVCLEALAAGVPVIGTKWGGQLDVVVDGVDGILVEPSSASEFVAGITDAMRRFIDDPELALTMGRKGRERVLHAFDWQLKAADYLAVFERACNPSAKPFEVGLTYDAHPTHLTGEKLNYAWP